MPSSHLPSLHLYLSSPSSSSPFIYHFLFSVHSFSALSFLSSLSHLLLILFPPFLSSSTSSFFYHSLLYLSSPLFSSPSLFNLISFSLSSLHHLYLPSPTSHSPSSPSSSLIPTCSLIPFSHTMHLSQSLLVFPFPSSLPPLQYVSLPAPNRCGPSSTCLRGLPLIWQDWAGAWSPPSVAILCNTP